MFPGGVCYPAVLRILNRPYDLILKPFGLNINIYETPCQYETKIAFYFSAGSYTEELVHGQ